MIWTLISKELLKEMVYLCAFCECGSRTLFRGNKIDRKSQNLTAVVFLGLLKPSLLLVLVFVYTIK